jgi:multiple sugar transport system substrate-binding protein
MATETTIRRPPAGPAGRAVIGRARTRRLAQVAAVAAAAVTLASCASAKQNSPSATGYTASPAGAKIVFANWGSQEAATQSDFASMLSGFNAATKADATSLGYPYQDEEQELETRLKAGQAPDVAQLDINWITTFAAQGALVDLNQVYGKATLANLYPANALKLGQWHGMQVALPWTLASIGLVANKQLLARAGITQMPVTTDEFAADLAKIRQTEPGVIPYALDTKTPALVTPFFEPWLWTFGGTIFKNGKVAIDSPGTVRALTYLAGLVKAGSIQKDVDIFTARTLFAQGKVAFYDDAIIAKGLVTDTSRASAVVPVPRPVVASGDAPQSIQWGHALVMFKKNRTAAQNSAAAQLITKLENPSLTGTYFKTQGLLPATIAGLQQTSAAKDPYQTAWAAITQTSRVDETAVYVDGAQISEIIGNNAQAAYLGIETPEQAAKAMSSALSQLNLK